MASSTRASIITAAVQLMRCAECGATAHLAMLGVPHYCGGVFEPVAAAEPPPLTEAIEQKEDR